MSILKRLAEQIADGLFVNGSGQRAERLVLTDEGGRDLGGWGQQPAADQIERILRRELLDPDACEKHAAEIGGGT